MSLQQQSEEHELTVPASWDSISPLRVEIKDGRVFTITVPPGLRPGDLLQFRIPGRTLQDLEPSVRVRHSRVPLPSAFSTSRTSIIVDDHFQLPTAPPSADSDSDSHLSATTHFMPLAPEFGEEDENVVRELLIQRCLELCRVEGTRTEDVTQRLLEDVISAEFGASRYERYKSLVEYFIKRNILQQQQKKESSGGGRRGSGSGSDEVSVQLELPRLVACVANCGFWGTPDTHNLCTKCFQNLVAQDVKQISDEEAVETLLKSVGFNSLNEYKLDLAFSKRFPNEVKGEHVRNNLPGVRQWFNTARPLTQFDKAPERGTTACTYISGVTAVRALIRQEYATDPAEWADCILRGVVAFHAAARSNMQLKGHSHISEALPFVMEVLGCRPSDAGNYIVQEKIVLLCLADSLEGATPSQCFGSSYVDEIGKHGLIPTLRDILTISIALVITRPPETWSVTLDKNSGIVRLRDSHRKAQIDFEDVNSFLSWVSIDRAFFAAVPSSSADFNSVAITWFEEKTCEHKRKEEQEEREKRQSQEDEFIFLDVPLAPVVLTLDKKGKLQNGLSGLSEQSAGHQVAKQTTTTTARTSHSSTSVATAAGVWNCIACTMENTKFQQFCSVCQTSKPRK